MMINGVDIDTLSSPADVIAMCWAVIDVTNPNGAGKGIHHDITDTDNAIFKNFYLSGAAAGVAASIKLMTGEPHTLGEYREAFAALFQEIQRQGEVLEAELQKSQAPTQ
jgi:hypothetical protein